MTRFQHLPEIQQMAATEAWEGFMNGKTADDAALELDAYDATPEWREGHDIGWNAANDWMIQQIKFGDGAYSYLQPRR